MHVENVCVHVSVCLSMCDCVCFYVNAWSDVFCVCFIPLTIVSTVLPSAHSHLIRAAVSSVSTHITANTVLVDRALKVFPFFPVLLA